MKPSFAAKLQPLPHHAIVKMAPLHLLDAKAQVRTTADKDAIKELANDIRRHGLLQPILLRPGAGGRFTIIAGHRRVTAARMVGLKVVPAIVGEADDSTARLMQLAENVHREDLTEEDLGAAVRTHYDKFFQPLAAPATLNNLKKFAVVASATDSIDIPLSRAISSATKRT